MDMGMLGAKLVAKISKVRHGKVIDFKAFAAGKAYAAGLQATVVGKGDLAGYDPSHALYLYAQNQVSVFSEQITSLPEMKAFYKLIAKAEDEYLPSGPPMSPLTPSYFTSWAFFDACVGAETIGTITMEVGAAIGMHPDLLKIIGIMQQSRMGIYIVEAGEPGAVVLKEPETGSVCRAIVPAGYVGRRGEIWYARVLPPLQGADHVVFTTPYVDEETPLQDWKAYFARTLPAQRGDAYERLMKDGPTRRYWNDYVFEAYVNHTPNAIFLTGLPELPESRPHSRVNSR
jgi:hypothetical protein